LPSNATFSSTYQSWSNTNRDTIASWLKAASLTADQFDSEEDTMSSLRSMSETADGQMKALQVGHEIAAQQVAQMQKLRGLVSQQMTMMGTWLQTEQTDKDLAQARREKFFNAEVKSVPEGQKWNRDGEPPCPDCLAARCRRCIVGSDSADRQFPKHRQTCAHRGAARRPGKILRLRQGAAADQGRPGDAPEMVKVTVARSFLITGLFLLAYAVPAFAQEGQVLTELENQVSSAAKGWETTIMEAAKSLFWILATIEISIAAVWLAIQSASLDSWFAELVRRIMFIGFFAFVLTQGPTFARAVVDSLFQIGAGGGSASPAEVFDAGIRVASQMSRKHSSGCSKTMHSRLPPFSPWASLSSPSRWSQLFSCRSWSKCMSACSPT
jgi:hypothetical protein